MNRIKTTFTLLLIVLTIGVSNAQFGVRAGLNLASLKVKANLFGLPIAVSTDDKVGGHIGAYYKSKLSEKLSIRPNLIFTTGGGKAVDDTTGESNSVSASYLGLPIDFMYTVPAGSNSLSLIGGPYLGYLLSSSSDEGSDEDEFTSTDIGLNFGLQFNVKKLGIGIVYGIGLTNVLPEIDTGTSFFGDASANTRIFSFYVTYDL